MTAANAKPVSLSALVVDGSDFHRSIGADLMRAAGAERVFLAANGDDALRILADSRPTIVLCDWAIAPMPALTFVKRVRAGYDGIQRNTTILMLASRVSVADVEASRAAGTDAFLAKPTSIGIVKERVKAILADQRPFIVSPTYTGPCRRRRTNIDYAGPLRRMTDPTAQTDDEESDSGLAFAKTCLARLANAISEMRPRDINSAQSVLARGLELRSVALDIQDAHLAQGAMELLRYVEGLGATYLLNAEALSVHVEALNQLAHVSRANTKERVQLILNLRKMVDRKLAQAAAISA
jgi:DNA-binding response OmpR family regulator